MKRWYIWIFGSIFFIMILAFMQYFGFIWHNSLFASIYQVKGLDVSHHQKKIDWKKVREDGGFQFVYMKATEGHDHTDTKFLYNWKEAQKSGFVVGAYHFFSMRSEGKKQAEHFIATVPKEDKQLPPVIDVEIHLDHSKEKVKRELWSLIRELENHYRQRPILYVTYDTYNQYIAGDFQRLDIWIRDIVKPPSLDNRKWLIWQYSNRGRVNGIETYVDMNAYQGSIQEFQKRFQLKP